MKDPLQGKTPPASEVYVVDEVAAGEAPDTTMTAQQAVVVLARVARDALGTLTPEAGRRVRSALAALDGMSIHASPFQPGQDVWCITRDCRDRWTVWETSYCPCMGYDVFASLEAAEREAARRNARQGGAGSANA